MSQRHPGHSAVVGLCWGDEGKGKVVDLLAPGFDMVVRYNGGANAGHTVCVDGQTFALHLIPSGVLHESVVGVIGPGVVVDPCTLLDEVDTLADRGVHIEGRLRISDRAHVVAEYHKLEDRLNEQSADGTDKIGTTVRGIGPCYADKARRTTALRCCDLLDPDRLHKRLGHIVDVKRRTFQALYGSDAGLDVDSIHEQLTAAAKRLGPFICDTTAELNQALADGRRLLFEGANGALLDVDHGTYPFVTSSSTGPWGICAGAGVPPRTVDHLVGVTKAYTTRVGSGPFPSELSDTVGDLIRDRGREYGTTTGRPRRCGWFDAVAVGHSVRLGGITEIALMHLDTLSGFEQIGICTAYRCGDRRLNTLPADSAALDSVEPIFEMLPGWSADLRACNSFEDLPERAVRFIERIEAAVGVRVTLISVGPDRCQTLLRPGTESVFGLPSATSAT